VLLDFLREYRGLRRSRRFVITSLHAFDPTDGVSNLPDNAREPVEEVIHYLEHLCLLINSRLISAKTVDRYMGGSVRRCWEQLEPFVSGERRHRGDQLYARYLEASWGDENNSAARRRVAARSISPGRDQHAASLCRFLRERPRAQSCRRNSARSTPETSMIWLSVPFARSRACIGTTMRCA
jgi:hypothetical protein